MPDAVAPEEAELTVPALTVTSKPAALLAVFVTDTVIVYAVLATQPVPGMPEIANTVFVLLLPWQPPPPQPTVLRPEMP